MLIANKKQFYDLSSKGLCGNAPMVWWGAGEFFSQSYIPKYITIRSLQFNSSFHKPIISVEDLRPIVAGVPDNSYVINEIPDPDMNRLIQGELTWVNGSWYFYYSRSSKPMRRALEESSKHIYGYAALQLLKANCTPSDYEDIMWIMDEYSAPNIGLYPVIELSVFAGCVGPIPHRNTLIWEVRNAY